MGGKVGILSQSGVLISVGARPVGQHDLSDSFRSVGQGCQGVHNWKRATAYPEHNEWPQEARLCRVLLAARFASEFCVPRSVCSALVVTETGRTLA